MAYQKDTANTIIQAVDKFFEFCCLHGGFVRLPNSGIVRGIQKGSMKWYIEPVIVNANSTWSKGSVVKCWMETSGGVIQPQPTYLAVWMFTEPFVAIDMFANETDCFLMLEVSDGVFTQVGIGNVKGLTFSNDVYFLTANGAISTEASGRYYDVTYDYERAAFFNCPTRRATSATKFKSGSYIYDGEFKETQYLNGVNFFCGHYNSLTDALIRRTPCSNNLRHVSPTIYYIAKNASENSQYLSGYIHGVRPCTCDLLSLRDIIMDNWMFFPCTALNNNNSLYPSGDNRGYLIWMGD